MSMYRVRAAITGDLVAGGGLSTFYYDLAGGTAPQAATATLTFLSGIASNCSNRVTWTVDPTVGIINEQNGDIIGTQVVTGGVVPGTSGLEALPPSQQALMQLRTGVFQNSREVRGRLFIPGITEFDSVGGVLSAAAILDLDAAGEALIADATSTWVVWARPGNPPGSIGAMAPVQSVSVPTKFAVLRSRRD